MGTGDSKPSFVEAVSYMNSNHSLLYNLALNKDVSVNSGLHIRHWSHKVIVL